MTQERVLPNFTPAKGGWVIAFWNIYIDESGDDNAESMFGVGGYLIEARRAILMEGKWRKFLAEHDLPFFHMVDAAHHSEAHPSELFDGMSEKDVDLLARNLIGLIKEYAQFGVVALTNPQRTKDFKDTYTALMLILLGRARAVAHNLDNRSDPPISIFVETGHNSKGVAEGVLTNMVRTWDGRHPPSVTFAAKRQVTLLQTADIICWQAAKRHKDVLSQERGVRRDFIELMKVNTEFFYLYEDSAGIQNLMRSDRLSKPEMSYPDRDGHENYVRALFGFGEDAEAVLAEMHAQFDRVNGPPHKKWTDPNPTPWEMG